MAAECKPTEDEVKALARLRLNTDFRHVLEFLRRREEHYKRVLVELDSSGWPAVQGRAREVGELIGYFNKREG